MKDMEHYGNMIEKWGADSWRWDFGHFGLSHRNAVLRIWWNGVPWGTSWPTGEQSSRAENSASKPWKILKNPSKSPSATVPPMFCKVFRTWDAGVPWSSLAQLRNAFMYFGPRVFKNLGFDANLFQTPLRCSTSHGRSKFGPTIWLWLTNSLPGTITILLRTVNHLFRLGPWLPWRTVSHNQRVILQETMSSGRVNSSPAVKSLQLQICMHSNKYLCSYNVDDKYSSVVLLVGNSLLNYWLQVD